MKKLAYMAMICASAVFFACAQKNEASKTAASGAAAAPAAEETPVAQASFNHSDPDVVQVKIKGAHCGDCYTTIKSEISGVEGVKAADADMDNKTMFVKVANNTPDMQSKINAAVVKAGFGVEGAARPDKEHCADGSKCADGDKCSKDGGKCADGGKCGKDGKCADGSDCKDACCKDGAKGQAKSSPDASAPSVK